METDQQCPLLLLVPAPKPELRAFYSVPLVLKNRLNAEDYWPTLASEARQALLRDEIKLRREYLKGHQQAVKALEKSIAMLETFLRKDETPTP